VSGYGYYNPDPLRYGSHVYVFSDGLHAKVGTTTSVKTRLTQVRWYIRTGRRAFMNWPPAVDPSRLEIVAAYPAHHSAEKSAHAAVSQWHTVGEWFTDCPEFRAALDAHMGALQPTP